ncbi:hypothetical protein BAVI_05729 [Neobacillus vireti LMG 21834]|uniref:Uncharacterized protein n=1 Tax=Neobacillus vireti LMG 21834 TaxID=1131730 RepID=A0AB94IS59_9BACI|nr:hypothetical protein BAVI_05729 [Neobacillus vireti LMG 21834]
MVLAGKQGDKFQTIQQVLDVMTEKLLALQRNEDHRVVFHHVYLLMTKEMQKRLSSGFFLDSDWMERVLVGFANFYFHAIDAYEAGLPCPPAWDLAFRITSENKGLVLLDALLGINAHINSDLPVVMYEILKEDQAWPDARIMLRRHQDHNRINDVLKDLIDIVQDELALHYDRFIHLIDLLMGRRDESFASFVLNHCRTNVWYNTELLLDASDEDQRNFLRQQIENDAHTIGLKIADSRPLKFTKYLSFFTKKKRWL